MLTPTTPTFSRITGTGSFLPPRRLTNADLAARLAEQGIASSDDWIVERTGIQARHFADESMCGTDLACVAARRALEAACLRPENIDLVVVATSTPDMIFPSSACILQGKLGIPCGAAFDVQAVCSGFIYALTVADALIRSGTAQKALVVGVDLLSRLLDFNDRSTCVLFGDGAGAVILEASTEPGILVSDIQANGQHAHILRTPGHVRAGQIQGDPFLRMDGQAVFKLAVGVLDNVARSVLDKAGLVPTDIDWLIPHQANIRIMQSSARKLGLPMDKVVVTVDQHGNTSAASVPLALDTAVQAGRIRPGQTLLLEAVGSGFTWGAVLLRM